MKLFDKNSQNTKTSALQEIGLSEVLLVSGGDGGVCPAGEYQVSVICVEGNNGQGATCRVECA